MTITLELPTDIEAYLRRLAVRAGQDEQAVALRLLSNLVRSEPSEEADILNESQGNGTPAARNMADLFAGRVSVAGGSGEAYSENGGSRFAAHLARKHGTFRPMDGPDDQA